MVVILTMFLCSNVSCTRKLLIYPTVKDIAVYVIICWIYVIEKCYQCAYSPPKTVYEKVKSYGHVSYYSLFTRASIPKTNETNLPLPSPSFHPST